MQRKQLIIAIVAGIGLSGAIAYAANRGVFAPVFSAPAASIASVSTPAASPFTATSYRSARAAYKPAPVPPTVDDVGDVDSFGRNMRWLGRTGASFGVTTDCANFGGGDPNVLCQQITDTSAHTSFAFDDIARITLPANASNSLLCHWVTPFFQAYFTSIPSGANPDFAGVSYYVKATVESPVLNDPRLIDPTTGAPFNGKLNPGSLTFEVFSTALVPSFYGQTTTQRKTVTCQSGVVSKRLLKDSFGLTQAQADAFFQNPITVRLSVSGRTRYVDSMVFSVGTRLVGD